MCFRLLAALDPPPEPAALEAVAFSAGLDVRASSRDPRFVEVAWGDCACSLYTRREGRERVVGFLEQLAGQGRSIELLLSQDDGELVGTEPVEVAWERLRAGGLAALTEGVVCRVR